MEGCFNLILSQNQQRWWHFLHFFFRGFSGATGFFPHIVKNLFGNTHSWHITTAFLRLRLSWRPIFASTVWSKAILSLALHSCQLFGNWVILHLITLTSELRLEVQKVRDYLRLLAGSSLIHITLGHIHFRKIPGNLAKTDIQKI